MPSDKHQRENRGDILSSVEHPDVVIAIFGAAVRPDGSPSPILRARVEAAARFARRCRAPLFLPTGAKGRFGDSEASVMGRLLRDLTPGARVLLEETGTDTLSSVRAMRHLLLQHGLHSPVYVATSGFHLPRCLLLLRLSGVRARACPPPRGPERWWNRLYWRVRELPALPYDAAMLLGLRLLGRW